jgi:putative phosphoribosyl transferase
MYFHSRAEAGQKLAAELTQYVRSDCIVVALDYGGVVIGQQIAMVLQCQLTMLLSQAITLPGEHLTIGTVNQNGGFIYNQAMSEGEIDEYYSEFHGYIEEQKREKFAALNRLLSGTGIVEAHSLKNKIVILVSDGFKTGIALDSAMEFLKPVKLNKLIIAVPVASVPAVDRMHILADELHCLSVKENYVSTDHYYDVDDRPNHETAQVIIAQSVQNWQ